MQENFTGWILYKFSRIFNGIVKKSSANKFKSHLNEILVETNLQFEQL